MDQDNLTAIQQYFNNLYKRKRLTGDTVGRGVIYNLIDMIDIMESETRKPGKNFKNSARLSELASELTNNELDIYYQYLSFENYLKSNYDIHSGYAQQFDNGTYRISNMYYNIIKTAIAKKAAKLIDNNNDNSIVTKMIDSYFEEDILHYKNETEASGRRYAVLLIVPAVKYITIFNTILQLLSEKLALPLLYSVLYIDLPLKSDKGFFDDIATEVSFVLESLGYAANKEKLFEELLDLSMRINKDSFTITEQAIDKAKEMLEMDNKNISFNLNILHKIYVDFMLDLDYQHIDQKILKI